MNKLSITMPTEQQYKKTNMSPVNLVNIKYLK